MGLEAVCRARYQRKVSQGKVLLETDELIFRGDFRLKIPRREIRSVTAKNGELHVKSGEGVAIFELGSRSEKWRMKILFPPGRLDKLDVKPGDSLGLICIRDETFLSEAAVRAGSIWHDKPQKNTGIIFLAAEALFALRQLVRLQKYIRPDGAIWVVYPKGQDYIREQDVLAAGRGAGLVDVKVVRFSETHTALKMVIPVAKRRAVAEEK